MKSIFEEMGGTYRQVGDYLVPNLILPDTSNYQIGKYGRINSIAKAHAFGNENQRRGLFLFLREFVFSFTEAGNRFNQSGML